LLCAHQEDVAEALPANGGIRERFLSVTIAATKAQGAVLL